MKKKFFSGRMNIAGFASVFLFWILLMDLAFAQLPTVEATGGSSVPINWPQRQKEEDADKDGPGFFYRDCSQGVIEPKASSELAPQGIYNYSVQNLADNNPMTAWVEGKPGLGIGEWFSVSSPAVNSIFNGYQATPVVWRNNSRVKKLKVYLDNKPICFLLLEDKMGEQKFELPVEVDPTKFHTYKFEIVEAYKGLKWDDVAISHVDNAGCCFGEETFLAAEDEPIRVNEVRTGSKVFAVDLGTHAVIQAEVVKTASQLHAVLWEIRTENHRIRVTADHPLAIRGYEFSSLSAARQKLGLGDCAALAGRTEVMVYDDGSRSLRFEKVISIEKISGTFKTYSLRSLSNGTAYLANGFVTRTY